MQLITADEKFRLSLPTEEDSKRIWTRIEAEFGGVWDLDAFRQFEAWRNEFLEEQRDRIARLAKIKAESARGETRTVAEVLRQIIDEKRLDIDLGSPEYRKLAHSIQRAEIEALTRAAERDVGDWSGEPKDKLVHARRRGRS